MATQQQIVDHGRAFEQLDVLECARDAGADDTMARQRGDIAAISMTRPALGSNTRVMALNTEVLPAPFGPMIANTSPCANRKAEVADRGDATERQRQVFDDEVAHR